MTKEQQISLIPHSLPGVNASLNGQKLKMSRYIILDETPCLPGVSAFIPLGHVTVAAPKYLAVWTVGRKGSWRGERSGFLFSFSKNQPQNH